MTTFSSWGAGNMDKYTIAEEAYKNGYDKGFEDAITQSGLRGTEISSRKAKCNMLKQELLHWGYEDWYSDTIDVIMVIANELSWRMIVRIIHKLRRKRGAKQ